MALSSSADVCVYGGAAGGGKSWALLFEPIRHIKNPAFGAVIFRRTFRQVASEGGLWDQSMRLYPLLGATPLVSELSWKFPSGARVKFAHLQHETNVLDWQGSELPLIGFDELTHFGEQSFWYLLSRNRSMCGVRPYVRATTNPDADSWVARLIEWWIDPDSGYAIPERAGRVRWFVRVNEKLVWADDPATLRAKHPEIPPKSLAFVPAKLTDNPALMRADPGYLANLMALPLVERERLLGGNWKVRPAAGKVFNRYWFQVVDAVPAGGEECRFFDFAATEKQLAGDDPDFTAAVKLRKVEGVYYFTGCITMREAPAAVERALLEVSLQDATAARETGTRYRVRWELEPGSASRINASRMVRMLDGLDAQGVSPKGDKVSRCRALAAQAEAGNVKVLRGDWNEELLSALHGFPDLPHDDIVDASSGSYNSLNDHRRLGTL